MVKIDKKDKRLIYELRRNCRQTYSQLAKSLGVSKQMAQYRINRLAKVGVLTKNRILVIDAGRLGYYNYGVYFQWNDVSYKDSFVNDLSKDPSVRYAAECSGRVDFVVSFYARSPLEFQSVWDRYLAKYGVPIKSHSISVSTENRAFDKTYLIETEKKEREEAFLGTVGETTEADELDLAILKALAADSRASIVSISKKCKIAPDTVKSRIKRMEKEGLIQGYAWSYDLKLVGVNLYELLLSLTNMDSGKWDELRSYCRSNPHVTYFIRSIGAFDVDIVFEVKSDEEFDNELHMLRKLFSNNIHDFEIVKITKEHQFKYAPFL